MCYRFQVGQGFFFPSSRSDRQFSHVASCPIRTFSRLVKQPECDANHSLPLTADVMNACSLPIPSHDIVFRYRGNFIFIMKMNLCSPSSGLFLIGQFLIKHWFSFEKWTWKGTYKVVGDHEGRDVFEQNLTCRSRPNVTC
jgi:hypothetical protein